MHCRICAITQGHPGVTFQDDVCNLCRLETDIELLANFKLATDNYEAFRKRPPRTDGEHDCLLMYSGGKDSTFILDQFVGEGRRVLAYTFDVPFESVRAAENVARGRAKLDATFVVDKDDARIQRMMREVFARPRPEGPGKYLDEKLPCVSCRTFFVLRAIIHAFERGISTIVMCADPQQFLTMESDVREIVRGYYRTFGSELIDELFGAALEALLFAEDERLPTIVFPFVAMRHTYDPDRIIATLEAKGLYESSPLETHCTLFPLLNYYSFKNWGCMFYKLNASSHVRSLTRNAKNDRATYSMKFPKSFDVLKVEERLRTILFAIAQGDGDPRAQEDAVIDVLKEFGASDDAARFTAANFVNMRAIAAQNGIPLP